MPTSHPLVSILMTAYNREKYIAEAIESVINSTYLNWELIITDDCSVDNTLSIAYKYANKDKRIKVFRNDKNLGDYPNRNQAAYYATGDYLMSVDSDDKILPESIAKCLELFLSFPEASFGVYSPHYTNPIVCNPQSTIQTHFFKNPLLLMGPGGTVIKNDYFKSIGGFPTKYGPANDGYYNLKAAANTNTILIPFELIFYRRHEGQEINNKYGYLFNSYLYLDDALKDLDLPINDIQKEYINNKNKRRFFVNIIKFYLRTLNLERTRYAIQRSGFTIKDAYKAIVH